MTVRWGFLGAGWIATKALAPAVHAAEGATLQAVAARDIARARALGPAAAVYDSYDAVLRSVREGLLLVDADGRVQLLNEEALALLDLADGRGLEPQNLGIRRATLEDVFLDLTGRALRD